MPHLRKRTASSIIQKELKWSPVVSVFGMRQCGKTTLTRQLSSSYLTLDDDSVISRFQAGDWAEVESATGTLTLDEAQKYGPLFDRVKLIVDRNRKPGRFILTGSVRTSLRKEIRESLTGRTTLIELLPLTITECHNRLLFDFSNAVFNHEPHGLINVLKKRVWSNQTVISQYLELGGMPGICFRRDAAVRSRLWASHLDTIFSRDLPLILKTKIATPKLREIYQWLARNQGQPLNRLALARAAGVSRPTIDSLLRAFEGLFLIRFHGNTCYCEDQGLASFVIGDHSLAPKYQWQRWIFCELLAQLRYLHADQFELGHYQTRGGAELPFVVKREKRGSLGIAFDTSTGATEKSQKSIHSFLKTAQSKGRGVILHLGQEAYVTPSSIPAIPIHWIA